MRASLCQESTGRRRQRRFLRANGASVQNRQPRISRGTAFMNFWRSEKFPDIEGALRQAGPKDRRLMILWTHAFQHEIGESADDTELRVDRGLAAGQLWLWDRNGETVSMAVAREPVDGVVRLSGGYTPPEKRQLGYAAPSVDALSRRLRDAGYRCILYTDLANPASNSIYRGIGYRAVAEALRYRFE